MCDCRVRDVDDDARDDGRVVAERRLFGGDKIFEQVDCRIRVPVIARVVADRRLDLEQRPHLRIEVAFGAGVSIEAGDHPRHDARQRFRENGGGQAGRDAGVVIGDAQPVPRLRAGADRLDFNVAYNPNCAYGSDKYNCPIPPSENMLNVALRVGEKRYAYLGSEKVY